MSKDLMNDPTVNKMWANRDTRLPFSAVWCGLLIKEGEIPAPVAVEYLRKEYNAAELESAAVKLDVAAEKAPRLADACQRGAAFIREQLLPEVTA